MSNKLYVFYYEPSTNEIWLPEKQTLYHAAAYCAKSMLGIDILKDRHMVFFKGK